MDVVGVPQGISHVTNVAYRDAGDQWQLLLNVEGGMRLIPLPCVLSMGPLLSEGPSQQSLEALLDQCAIHHTEFYPDDIRKTLQAVMDSATMIALDPLVSPEAQALIDKGKQQRDVEWAAALATAIGPSTGIRVPLYPYAPAVKATLSDFKKL